MTLIIDLGNSRLKWARLGQQSDGSKGAIEHGGRLSETTLKQLGGDGPAPQAVVCAAVASQDLIDSLTDFCARVWGIDVEYVLSSDRFLGLVNSYQQPERLGVDRWLAMLAARRIIDGWFCLIDAGTAITVDLVDAQGQHHGGWIMPGENLMHRSLIEHTGRIKTEPALVDAAWGVSTADAVALGTQAAVAGLVAEAQRKVMDFATERPQFVVTGGCGSRIIEYLNGPVMLVPDLVLDGLALWVREMHND